MNLPKVYDEASFTKIVNGNCLAVEYLGKNETS